LPGSPSDPETNARGFAAALDEKLFMKTVTKIIKLIFILLVIACKKENDSSDSFHPTFNALINNVSVSLSESNNTFWNCGSLSDPQLNGSDSSLFQFELSLFQYYKPDSIYHNSVFIYFINHIPKDSLDPLNKPPDLFESMFRNLLKVNDYPYTFDSYKKGGVIVTWYDNKGVLWVSGKNRIENNAFPATLPDYSENTFIIDYSRAVLPPFSFYTWSQEVHLKFTCKLYNYFGDSLLLENGMLNGIYSYIKK
jgi:hypothetical protein